MILKIAKRITAIFIGFLYPTILIAQIKDLLQDSTVDQTSTLQRAISVRTGGTLILPKGVYLVTRLNLVSNLILIGTGTKLKINKIEAKNNKLLNIVGLSNVTIQELELDLSNASGSIWDGTPAIEIRNSSNIRILNCYIHDNKYLGVRLGGGNDSITVADNIIENTDTGIHANNKNTRLLFIGNKIFGGTSEGITIYGYNEENEPSDFLIESNIIKGKKESWGISIPFAKNGSIKNNTIQNCRSGIGMHDVVSTHNANLNTKDLQIAGNSILECKTSIEKSKDSIFIGKNNIIISPN